MKKILILYLLLLSCNLPEKYNVIGVIKEIDFDKKRLLIDHDKISGFMDPMIMYFNIHKSINLENFELGDSVSFDLLVNDKKSSTLNYRVLGKSKKLINSKNDFWGEDEDSIYKLKNPGDFVDDATFLNLSGTEVNLSGFNKSFTVISFIFSRCPMPNMCPAAIIKNQYLAETFKNDIDFLLISFDYNYDTPKVLKKAYGNIFEDYSNIHFLSSYGYKENILRLTMEAGLGFSGIDEGDARDINHTLKSLLISPEGMLIESFGGDTWLPKEVELNIKSRLKAYGLN